MIYVVVTIQPWFIATLMAVAVLIAVALIDLERRR